MTPALRKLTLTAHVTCSLGWFGAIAGFLALAIAGLAGSDAAIVRAAYVAMRLTTWFVIVPLSLAALMTGITLSLGTRWGIFRYYWIVSKLALTVFAVVVLFLKTGPINYLAQVAESTTLSDSALRSLRIAMVAHAGGGLLVLLLITTLSVYKPWGLTAYGLRMRERDRAVGVVLRASPGAIVVDRTASSWLIVLLIAIAVIATAILLHVIGGGMGIHHH